MHNRKNSKRKKRKTGILILRIFVFFFFFLIFFAAIGHGEKNQKYPFASSDYEITGDYAYQILSITVVGVGIAIVILALAVLRGFLAGQRNREKSRDRQAELRNLRKFSRSFRIKTLRQPKQRCERIGRRNNVYRADNIFNLHELLNTLLYFIQTYILIVFYIERFCIILTDMRRFMSTAPAQRASAKSPYF